MLGTHVLQLLKLRVWLEQGSTVFADEHLLSLRPWILWLFPVQAGCAVASRDHATPGLNDSLSCSEGFCFEHVR